MVVKVMMGVDVVLPEEVNVILLMIKYGGKCSNKVVMVVVVVVEEQSREKKLLSGGAYERLGYKNGSGGAWWFCVYGSGC